MRRWIFSFLTIMALLFGPFAVLAAPDDDGILQSLTGKPMPSLPIVSLLDHKTLAVHADSMSRPDVGQVYAIRSRTASVKYIGYAEITSVREYINGESDVRARVLRLSRTNMVRIGDELVQLDLRTVQPSYLGHTELLVKDKWTQVSARYRPLFHQGLSIGQTAQTLGSREIFLSIYGDFAYGLTEGWTAGALLSGYVVQAPNGQVKMRIYDSPSDTVSFALSAAKTKESLATGVNMTLYWDSITSDSMISHTLATFAVATFEKVEDTVAVKAAGSSSLQTGYELLMSNWDRMLFGPSYNFETKSIGGYLAYKRIWNQFHLSGSISAVNLRELQFNIKTGYVGLIEAYWRY